MIAENKKYSSIILISILIISVFLLLFTTSISYKQYNSLLESEKRVIHTHIISEELLNLLSILKDAETGQRGYLLTRDTSFLESYHGAFDNVTTSFFKIKKLTIDNPNQQQNLDTLEYLINKRFKLLATVLQESYTDSLIKPYVQTLLKSGKNMMNEIRTKVADMNNVEHTLLKIQEAKHSQIVSISPFIYLLSSLIALIVFAFAFFKINTDLNHLKKSNNQLLINEQLFEHNEQIAQISSWCWNVEANKITYSHNQFRLFGCEVNEFEPTIESFLKFVHPDDKQLIIDGSKNALTNLTPSTAYFRIIRKDGELRYLKSVGKLITDGYGKNIIIGINADITDQYHSNKNLEDRLFDLERSNKELSAFNHVASHDLQEPLRKIQTFISRIKEKEFNNLSDNAKDYFLRTQASANRMQLLIADLLAFSRANKADKIFEFVDLNILLENSKQELSQVIEQKGATINTHLLSSLNVIPFQIQQLFTNIISNALKYSKADVLPIITINTEIIYKKDISNPSYTNESIMHKISITDNGIGFEQAQAENIFTLFNRLHSDKEYSGTGIGLTICKKIVENHKGFITVEGFPNIGSTFNIYLPA